MCQYFGISPDLNHPAAKFVLETSINSLDICALFVATVFRSLKME
jgi:hypothetical protein